MVLMTVTLELHPQSMLLPMTHLCLLYIYPQNEFD